MNKKIFALVLGATMLAAGAFAFAGCGHKHSYEISYRVADCDSEGYTLHTCRDCGYSYADGFIAPYGHAYRAYYHALEDNEGVQSVKYSLTEKSLSHYLPYAEINEAGLRQLQSSGSKLCVHRECEFCDDALGLPEDKVIEFNEMMEQFMRGAEYEPVINPSMPGAQFLEDLWHAQSYEIPRMEFNPSQGRSVVRSDDTINLDDFVLKTTIRSDEADFGEVECDNIYVLMPDCVEVIEDNAFGGREKIERVYLSQNLKTIGKDVFKNSSLDSVIIPKSVQTIGSGAFGGCGDLKIVYFSGTQEEWNAIQIATGNDALKNAPRYYYSERKPTTSGNFWHYVDEEPTLW